MKNTILLIFCFVSFGLSAQTELKGTFNITEIIDLITNKRDTVEKHFDFKIEFYNSEGLLVNGCNTCEGVYKIFKDRIKIINMGGCTEVACFPDYDSDYMNLIRYVEKYSFSNKTLILESKSKRLIFTKIRD